MMRNGTNTSFGQLQQIDAGLLNVGYAEAGPSDGPAVMLLHGWPYDIHSYVDVAPRLAQAGYRVIVPYLRGYGTTRFLSSDTFRNGQQSVVAVDLIALLDALKIERAILAGFDWGARTADIIAALWPERCKALVSVSGYLIGSQQVGQVPLPPQAELQWWYQYYFATERGQAGYRVIIPYLRGYGTTRFLSNDTFRNGQQSAVALDSIALMDALRIEKAILAGFDWGARAADIVAALWPERCKALVSVSGYLIGSQQAGKVPLPPQAELQWWYQYYFATERGRAGYETYRHDFAKLIWQLASPHWDFDNATFERSAVAFDNPDHVSIVIHNYRWRLGLAEGEPQYDELEQRLAKGPAITVPTITLEGDANGAPHPEASAYVSKFSGRYAHRIITGGVGHNLPQEAPGDFAQAIVDVDAYESSA